MATEREMNGKGYPKRLDHVVWKVLEGRGVLLNLENGAYFEVNPVGLSIWEKCDGKKSSGAIVQSVAREFKEDLERVQRDFSRFAAELKRRKLLEVSPAPSAAGAPVLKKTR